MSGEGTYTCSLDKAGLSKAKKELNEDPKQRASQIEALRKWCTQQPHLNTRTDDVFLLRFLRNAKFSLLKAQEKLDHFLTIRSVESKGAPQWFKDMDPHDPKVSEILDKGCNLVLPDRDQHNRKVVIINTGAWCDEPDKYTFDDIMKVGYMCTDIMLLDEVTQVYGAVLLLDFTQFGAHNIFYWSRDVISKASSCWFDAYPTRLKGINYYNTPILFNALLEIFKLFMKQKTLDRLHFHKDNLKSVYKEIPKKILPNEYGGEAGTIKDIAKQWKEHMIKNHDEIKRNNTLSVDESKRPKSEEQNGGWGISGTFRKLAME